MDAQYRRFFAERRQPCADHWNTATLDSMLRDAQNRRNTQAADATGVADDSFFLPDLCSVTHVLVILLVAELLAIVLNLAANAPQLQWDNLGLISLLVQWIALTSAATLCLLRRPLGRLGTLQAGLISYVILVLITLLVSELCYRLIGNYSAGISVDADFHADFILRNMLVSMIVSAVLLRYFYIQHQWKQHIELESRARIQALQARIRPHFLFNSMNVIAALTRSDPKLAEQAVEDLADLFRVSMADASRLIPLSQEIEIVKRYLHIESLRLAERLQVDWEIGELDMDIQIPPLLIQPLIENAVYHGIETSVTGGTIRLRLYSDNGLLHILIHNPIDTRSTHRHDKGNRLAQENIKERLQSIYGSAAGIVIQATPSDYQVKIHLPVRGRPS